MTTTYSISFDYQEQASGTFHGRFTVDNATSVIQSFYDNKNPNVKMPFPENIHMVARVPRERPVSQRFWMVDHFK